MTKLLSSDPIQRRTDLWHPEGDGGAVIESRQDVEDIIELNKADYNERSGHKHGVFHHKARIPLVIADDLMRQGILTMHGKIADPQRLKDWLNDPDNRAFLTLPGKV